MPQPTTAQPAGLYDLRNGRTTRAAVITIDQLDGNGAAWRTFTLYPANEAELAAKLERIGRGYNMAHTRVVVSALPR
jgi:hypothetical protein